MVISCEDPTPAPLGSLNLCNEVIRVKQITVGLALAPIIFDGAAVATTKIIAEPESVHAPIPTLGSSIKVTRGRISVGRSLAGSYLTPLSSPCRAVCLPALTHADRGLDEREEVVTLKTNGATTRPASLPVQ